MALSEPERPPTILKNSWTRSHSNSFDETNGQSYQSNTESSCDNSPDVPPKHDKPRKKVSFRLSDLRRQSLTGSLPDLAKASDQEVSKCSTDLVDLQISRDPLPEGSLAFRAVMDELDDTDDSEGDSKDRVVTDVLSHSWSCGNGNDKIYSDHGNKKQYSALGQTFQSKAAALIYSKTFLHKRNKSNGAVVSNNIGSNSQRTMTVVTGKLPSIGSQKSVGQQAIPESPRSPVNKIQNSKTVSAHCSSPAPKLSPLVSGEVSAVVVSNNKAGIRRQMSEPRLLQRSKQKRRLTKSSSVD